MTDPSRISGSGANWQTNAAYQASGTGQASAVATVGPTGSLGGHTVQQQATAQATGQRNGIGQRLAAFFQNTLPSFFKDVGTALKTLFSPAPGAAANTAPATAVAAPVPRTFGENRAALQDLLPAGITVDDRGIISGTYNPTRFAAGLPGPQAGRGIIDVAEQSSRESLTPAPGKTLPTIANIPCVAQASSDFYRLNLTVANGAQTFTSRGDTATDQGTRNTNVMQAVKALTNDNNAATVLSAVLNQQFSRYLLETMETASGSYAQFQPLSVSAGQIDIRADDGSVASEVPKGIGGAPMSLSKLPNGDYKFEVTWDNLFRESGRGSSKVALPGMGDTAMRALSRLEFVIDGNAARQGQLSISMPNPATITFSGRMAPPG